ncbi:MAG: Tyrosine--tRNA ligase [Chlamydiae bacterium]|nr:Tyrosine--tRNA ligase [Chlamydiota bacterium]
MTNVIQILKKRGLIEAMTSEELCDLAENPLKVYCGFDPTSDSLHLGNMVAIMGLAWFQRLGHTPIALIGGATGMIGDPSGKAKERRLLDEKTLRKNAEGIKKDLETVLDFDHPTSKAMMIDNLDWLGEFSFIHFLREVGSCFRVGTMLAKESVRLRLNSEEGISFTEFSYQLLQAYDFLYLNEKFGVNVQIGGSDQWGNITAGIDLVRRVRGEQAYGVTFPLLMTSDGKKFGKSEEGAIWLSSEKCSHYQFYQHLFRVTDADVIRLMRMLTFMDMEEIHEYERKMLQPDYVPNTAQKRLAEEVTRIVRGEEGLQTALRVTSTAKPGSDTALDAETLESIAADMPSCTLKAQEVVNEKVVNLLVYTKLQSSRGQARRLIINGGVYLNNEKMADENRVISQEDLIDGRMLLLGVGRKNKKLIRLSKENE